MSTNLVTSVSNALSSELVSRIAWGLGIDRAAVEKAIAASIPSLLAAFTSLVAKPAGVAKLGNAVAQQPAGILTNIANAMGKPGYDDVISSGTGTLASLLGGKTLSALTQAVSKYANIGEDGSTNLLGLVGPILLSVLGQKQRENGLDASGLARLIASQKDSIARAIPPGFTGQLSGTEILENIGSPRFGYRAPLPEQSSHWGWVLPVLAAAAIASLGLYVLGQTSRTTETLPQAGIESPSSSTQPFIVTDAESKGWIGRPVYGIDGKKIGDILEMERDGTNKVTDIYVDTGSFLGFGGTRLRFSADQIRNIRSDSLVLTLKGSDLNAAKPY